MSEHTTTEHMEDLSDHDQEKQPEAGLEAEAPLVGILPPRRIRLKPPIQCASAEEIAQLPNICCALIRKGERCKRPRFEENNMCKQHSRLVRWREIMVVLAERQQALKEEREAQAAATAAKAPPKAKAKRALREPKPKPPREPKITKRQQKKMLPFVAFHDPEQLNQCNYVEVETRDIDGILYFIDAAGNVYCTEDVMQHRMNPRIIGRWEMIEGAAK